MPSPPLPAADPAQDSVSRLVGRHAPLRLPINLVKRTDQVPVARARSLSPGAPSSVPVAAPPTEPMTSTAWRASAGQALLTASPVRPVAVSPPRLKGPPSSPSSASAPAGLRCQSSPRLHATVVSPPQVQSSWSRHIAPLPLYSRAGKPVTVPTSHRSYIVQTPPVPAKTVMHRSSSAAGQLVTEPITGRLQAPPGMPRLASCEASAPTSAASSSRLPSKEVEPDERPAVLERLKVLLADPGIVAKTLKSCYEAVGGLPQGQVPCDAAVKALVTAHSMLLKGLSSTSISEAKWRSLLKKAGIYSPEEGVTLDQLREVQAQTLGSLRDCFAPKQLLRSMRRVPRSEPRLKDRYECFEFRAKAALGKVFRCRHIESQSLAEVRQIRKDKVCVPMDYIRTSLHRISELNHPNVPRLVDCLEEKSVVSRCCGRNAE
ncbi:Calcium-dependent protein kinase 1 [Durusdinium trenchii]|uniref:Calcium-dependent protein kinase 1 n=2 Tax=Durusdinium trenchii TaxID=1381693 RepID=A0ABP0Q5S9_9DINO